MSAPRKSQRKRVSISGTLGPPKEWNPTAYDWNLRTMTTAQFGATAQFGDPGWLALMLSPLNTELTQVFLHQPPSVVERTTIPVPLSHRIRYALALGRITEVFGATGFNRLVVEQLLELGLALLELDHGIVRHFLEPVKAQNRPPDPGDIWMAKAYVAIALDIIENDPDASIDKASKMIAKHFGYLACVLAPETENFAGLVKSWRIRFLNRQISDDRAQSIFDKRAELVALYIEKMAADGKAFSGVALSALLLQEAVMIAIRAADLDAVARLLPVKPKPKTNRRS